MGLLFLVLTGTGSGCTGLPLWEHNDIPGPPSGKVVEMVPSWLPQVAFPPDRLHDGQPTPALVLRMYLFDKKLKPCRAEGHLEVKLRLGSPGNALQQGKVLETWKLTPQMLQPLAKPDRMFKWVYTVPLPWATYDPGLTKFVMDLKYTTKDGHVIYKRNNVKLSDGPVTFDARRRTVPGAAGPNHAIPVPSTFGTPTPGVSPSVSLGKAQQQ